MAGGVDRPPRRPADRQLPRGPRARTGDLHRGGPYVRNDDGQPGIWFAVFEGGGPTRPGSWRWRRHLDKAGMWPVTWSIFATGLGMAWRKPGSLDLFVAARNMELYHNQRDGDVSGDWEYITHTTGEGGYTTTPWVPPWWNHDNADLSSLHAVACYSPFELTGGALLLESWLGKHWAGQHTIYTEGSTDGRGGLGLTQGSTRDLRS